VQCPVVCSNRTSLAEVVGDTVITLGLEGTVALTDAMWLCPH